MSSKVQNDRGTSDLEGRENKEGSLERGESLRNIRIDEEITDKQRAGATQNNITKETANSFPTPEEPIRDCNSIVEIHELMSKRNKRIVAGVCIVVYFALWIIYAIFREQLWDQSLKASSSLSKYSGFLHVYSWIFSEIFYKWYVLIIGILLLCAPRKDSAVKSIACFILSYFCRQYLRLLIEESRP